MIKILVVEDEELIRIGLKYCLEEDGFSISLCENASTALELVRTNDFDLMLLDLNLPDMNGFDLFKKIKEIKSIPTIFLTANDLETSVVMGLNMGAYDYITKPFKTLELVARIKNVLRRTTNEITNIKIDDVEIDIKQAKVLKDNKDLFLTALEYKILVTLALNPDKIFTREKLLADIWDVNEEFVNDNTLTVYIKRIREKLGDDPVNPKIIITVRGIGYKIGEIK